MWKREFVICDTDRKFLAFPLCTKHRELDLRKKTHGKSVLMPWVEMESMTLQKARSLQRLTGLFVLMLREGKAQGSRAVLQLPVAVVMVFVIAAQSCQASQTNCIRKEDLSACIHPDLQGRCKHR